MELMPPGPLGVRLGTAGVAWFTQRLQGKMKDGIV